MNLWQNLWREFYRNFLSFINPAAREVVQPSIRYSALVIMVQSMRLATLALVRRRRSRALIVIGTVTATQGFVGNIAGASNISSTNISATTFTAGSATVTTFTTTGSATVTGTLTASNGKFTVDGSDGLGNGGKPHHPSTGTLTVAGGLFKVDETGSMTVKTLAVTGTVTMAISER